MSTEKLFDPAASPLLKGVHNDDAVASLFIDGQWQPAADGETRTIINPADGPQVGIVPEASERGTVGAIGVARRPFDAGEWRAGPAVERGKILVKVADLIRENKDEFARAEAADTGKRLPE